MTMITTERTDGLICPVCGEKLADGGGRLVCARGHSFDFSSAGYCNLLRPGRKNNSRAGDDKDMVSARSSFLSAGYYAPVRDFVIDAAAAVCGADGAGYAVLIDAGCGEGYYTNAITSAHGKLRAIGIDASKHATSSAARSARRLGIADRVIYLTASLSEMPVADCAADCVMSLFAPCVYGEFARVTREGGILIIGSAGTDHLRELKKVVYGEDSVRANVPIDHGALAGEFYERIGSENVKYAKTVEGEHIAALFGMTPYKWRSPKSGVEALLALDSIEVTVEVDFTILRRR